ncbi:hypothetical protein [Actinomadura darangshiensis]|uniref:hypothetical protein n=1 Tax=Actinomadura darangshiensis TaxID=705336 RepID=UPI001050FD2E|nr:hypothetical protein [Actinomadura darangshiensis]
MSGEGQDIEVNGVDLSIIEIKKHGMTVSADGSPMTTVSVGENLRVGHVQIRVTSADGEKVKFDMR